LDEPAWLIFRVNAHTDAEEEEEEEEEDEEEEEEGEEEGRSRRISRISKVGRVLIMTTPPCQVLEDRQRQPRVGRGEVAARRHAQRGCDHRLGRELFARHALEIGRVHHTRGAQHRGDAGDVDIGIVRPERLRSRAQHAPHVVVRE